MADIISFPSNEITFKEKLEAVTDMYADDEDLAHFAIICWNHDKMPEGFFTFVDSELTKKQRKKLLLDFAKLLNLV